MIKKTEHYEIAEVNIGQLRAKPIGIYFSTKKNISKNMKIDG